jgi:hypothetical protein
MAAKTILKNIEDYRNHVKSFEGNQEKQIILFTADFKADAVCPFRQGGKPESWCSDCNQSFDLIDRLVTKYLAQDPSATFTMVTINRDCWKKPDCKFRTEADVERIPTLLHLKSGRKAVEAECLDEQKINYVLFG